MFGYNAAIIRARVLVIPACLTLTATAAVCVFPMNAAAQFSVEIYAPAPPPPLVEYDQPPLPDDGYIWTPGYWAYGEFGYFWVPGIWVLPPEAGLLWTPGYWGFVNGRYGFNPGYWGPHVGFYGGIDYGFGYTGEGYFGGEWRNGVFAYNRSVNNFGVVRINNVYDRPVVRNVTANRVSFNGPGGIVRRPTPQEASFASERHVPPSRVQVQHRDMASRAPALRNSVTHGHPTVTATARPAVMPAPEAVDKKPASVGHPAKTSAGAARTTDTDSTAAHGPPPAVRMVRHPARPAVVHVRSPGEPAAVARPVTPHAPAPDSSHPEK